MTSTDVIEREMVIGAPIQRVWAAITVPEEMRNWFGDIADFELRPGAGGKVGWTEFENTTELVVESVEPPNHFAYRWSARANSAFDFETSTRVDFYLEDLNGRTRLRLVESGFDGLPDDLAEAAHEENSSGWTHELSDLTRYLDEALIQ